MLGPAQEAVARLELRSGLRRNAAGAGQGFERVAGRRQAQLRHAPAPDELLRLGEELDLADAAAAELDVVARDLDAASAAMRVDLPLDRVDVLDRREIEMLAPQERRQLGEEFLPRLAVAGDGARLDEGGALPVLACAFIIRERRLERDRRRGRGGVRPEAQVGAEHISLGRALAHDALKIVREAGEEALHAALAAIARALGVIKQDEIDVARIVELQGAELAEAEHDEAVPARRIARLRKLDLARVCGGAEQVLHRNIERQVRQSG